MLQKLLSPKAVAVIGASTNPTAIGGQPIRQLLRHGFGGAIYPVNPNRDTVQGLPCYASLDAVPDGVDVAIIAVPARHVIEVLNQCGSRGIPFAVVLSAGFADAGGDGLTLQRDLVDTAQQQGMRLLGPNCVGYINAEDGVYGGFGAFFEYEFAPGPVGFVTQSGGVGGSLLTIADDEGIGFRHFVHTGNAADLDIEAVLDGFVDDPDTRVLAAYLEGLGPESRLGAVADRALRADKPLVAWKAGKSDASGSAVVSHTGRLAGAIDRYRAVFDKYGVIEVEDTDDLIDVLRLAQSGAPPAGPRVGVVSVSGGAGVIAADCLDTAQNLDLATFDADTRERVASLLPSFATAANPIDVTAQIFNEPELFEKVVTVLCEQDQVDVIVACVASVHSEVGERIARAIAETQQAVNIPVVVVWAARESVNGTAFSLLRDADVPLYRSPERALRALDCMMRFRAARDSLPRPPEERSSAEPPADSVRWHRSTEYDALEILARYGIPTPAQSLVHSETEAATAATRIGPPVVMKVQSPDIPHKAAAGGVRLNVGDATTAARAFTDLAALAPFADDDAEYRGVLVQECAPGDVEIICGYVHDEVLGGFLLCGTGGSDVEHARDTQLIPLPATRDELDAALQRLRVHPRLSNLPGAVERSIDVLVRLQRLAQDHATTVGEIEINPLVIGPSGCTAVDALAVALPPSTLA